MRTQTRKNAREIRAALPISSSTFYILLSLAGGDRHGYGIIKEVEAHTVGTVKLAPGTLYRLIKQLLSDGYIVEIEGDQPNDSERRRYYRLTERGRAVAIAEAQSLEELVTIARKRRLLPSLAAI